MTAETGNAKLRVPGWLYHPDGRAQVFYTEETRKKALSAGWVDSPIEAERQSEMNAANDRMGQVTPTRKGRPRKNVSEKAN